MLLPKVVNVSLKGDVLDVDDAGALQFKSSKAVRRIEWRLSGSALDDAFFPGSDSGVEAFALVKAPRFDVVCNAVVIDAGRTLVAINKHFNVGSMGDFVYLLRVGTPDSSLPGGVRYYTTTYDEPPPPPPPPTTSGPKPGGKGKGKGRKGVRTINNPVIVNH